MFRFCWISRSSLARTVVYFGDSLWTVFSYACWSCHFVCLLFNRTWKVTAFAPTWLIVVRFWKSPPRCCWLPLRWGALFTVDAVFPLIVWIFNLFHLSRWSYFVSADLRDSCWLKCVRKRDAGYRCFLILVCESYYPQKHFYIHVHISIYIYYHYTRWFYFADLFGSVIIISWLVSNVCNVLMLQCICLCTNTSARFARTQPPMLRECWSPAISLFVSILFGLNWAICAKIGSIV